jgi:hypothetical protein
LDGLREAVTATNFALLSRSGEFDLARWMDGFVAVFAGHRWLQGKVDFLFMNRDQVRRIDRSRKRGFD